MKPELETYFNNYNELFNQEGYKQLIQELSDNVITLSDIQTVKDTEDFLFRKGQVAALATVINLESTMMVSRELAEEEGEDD